jgi:hypothetical protein
MAEQIKKKSWMEANFDVANLERPFSRYYPLIPVRQLAVSDKLELLRRVELDRALLVQNRNW